MDEHREWDQAAVCAEVGTEAIVPLWHRDRRAVGELLDAGFVAVIVAVREGVRPTSPLGRTLDAGWPRPARATASSSTGRSSGTPSRWSLVR
jgi:diphthamide synthase (EF-2-diphthine--ammonia ligase)